jgi:hypothetical protein
VALGLLVIAAGVGYFIYEKKDLLFAPTISQPAPQTAPQTAPEPASQTAPEPTPQATPEPAPQAAPEPAPQAEPEPTPQAAPEPASQAEPEPAPQAAPEPTPQTAPEPEKPARFFEDIYTEKDFGPLLKTPVKVPGTAFSLFAYKEEKDGSTIALYSGSISDRTRQALVKNGLDEATSDKVDSNKFIYRYMPDGKKYQKLHDGYYAADNELLFDGPVGTVTLEIQSDQISGKGYAKIPGKAPAPKPVSPAAKKDPKEAAEKAAELYRKGQERYKTKDYKGALPYYLQAADAGYAPAQFSLGIMYENGYGVNKDYAQAVSWFRKAADRGYASAQFSLGVMYRYGDGVNRDYTQAVSWFRKAAAQGHSYAQKALEQLEKGGEIPK